MANIKVNPQQFQVDEDDPWSSITKPVAPVRKRRVTRPPNALPLPQTPTPAPTTVAPVPTPPDNTVAVTGVAQSNVQHPTAGQTVTRRVRKVTKPLVRLPKVQRDGRLAIVPDYARYETYVGRAIEGVDYVQVFDVARHNRRNVLLSGPTGSGKTHAVEAYAALRQLPFYSISSSVAVEPSQLFGKFIPDPDNARGLMWQDGPVTDIFRYGGVLLINEVNFIPERISTVLFPALDYRRTMTLVDHKGEVIVGHGNLLIVADMNPGYSGTRPLNIAFRNRFAVQLTWAYVNDIEAKMVRSTVLLDMARKIRTDQQAEAVQTPISTNMIVEFEELVGELQSVQFACENLVNHFDVRERAVINAIVRPFVQNLINDYKNLGVL